MTIEDFWKLIDQVQDDDMETKCERLGQELRKLSAEEVNSFNDQFAACLHQANKQCILDTATILLGKDLTKEDFEAYRSVMISFGREGFEKILSEPLRLDNRIHDCSDVYNKLFGQIASHVSKETTKKTLGTSKPCPEAPSGPKLNPADHGLSYHYLTDGHSVQVLKRKAAAEEERKAEEQRQTESEAANKLLEGVTAEKIKVAEKARAFGELKLKQSDWDGAIADFTQAIEANPTFPNAYVKRGVARSEKGDAAGAIADYTKAIEIKPRYIDAYRKRQAARIAAEDWEGAAPDLDTVKELLESRLGESVNQGLIDREWLECNKTWSRKDLDSYTTYKLPLIYSFTLPTLEAAEQLRQGVQERKGYQVEVRQQDIPGYKTWRVRCSTQKQLKDPGDLMDWVMEMMEVGREFGCEIGRWRVDRFDFEPICSPERLKEIEESGGELEGDDPEDDEDGS